jgi:hypothetical protein
MSRRKSIYENVPSIKAGDKIFQSHEEAAAHLIQCMKWPTGFSIDQAKFIVSNRSEVMRILSFPAPRKTRGPNKPKTPELPMA